MSSTGVINVMRHEGGWLVSASGAPIGYIDASGAVITPSGARYTTDGTAGRMTMASDGGGAVATLEGSLLRDEVSGIEWAVRPDWSEAFIDGGLDTDAIWAVPYSLEDAQGIVPNRVRLLLAWIITR